jgi:ADP-heptose:LPS heptosyltransferase
MSFRAKQIVDFWLGSLLLLVLFLPVRGLGLLLRRDHSLAERRGCAVVKLVGAGSLFLAMPSLQAIREKFPRGKFFLVGTRAVTGFAQGFGWFDESWVIDDSSLLRLVGSTLRAIGKIAWHCDHLVDLEVHSRLTTVFSVLTAVRNRIGFVDEIVFWRRGFYTHMTYFNAQGPVYAFYDMLAAWFGVERVAVTDCHAAFRACIIGQSLPTDIMLPQRYVVVGPGCSEFGKERQVYPDEWRRLLATAEIPGSEVVLLGGESDRAICAALAAALGDACDLCGRLSIAQSARVLCGATRYYGIDSLLLHLARALQVPAVSVWGPSDPATRLRPMYAAESVFFANMSCSPCIHVHETPPCRGARTCIPNALAAAPRNAADRRSAGSGAARVAVGWATGPHDRSVRPIQVRYD